MNKLLFSLVIVALTFISCGPDVVKYNDTVVDIHTEIFTVQNDFDTKLQNAIETDSYADIKAAADEALSKIDANIEKVKGLDVPSGAEAFQESAVTLFQSVKSLVESGAKFAAFTSESSEDDINKVIDEYNTISDKVSDADDVMEKAQKELAKAKGFDLR
jgi:hypothetical protein